jgi:hypothetical protein
VTESRAVQNFVDLKEMELYLSDVKFKNKPISKITLALIHEIQDKAENMEQALKIWNEL